MILLTAVYDPSEFFTLYHCMSGKANYDVCNKEPQIKVGESSILRELRQARSEVLSNWNARQFKTILDSV